MSIFKRLHLSTVNSAYPIPEELKGILEHYCQYAYKELYEKAEDYPIPLDECLKKVLSVLDARDNPKLTHFRHFSLTVVLVLAVQHTIRAYLSRIGKKDNLTKAILDYLVVKALCDEASIIEGLSLQDYLRDKQELIDSNLTILQRNLWKEDAFREAIAVLQNSLNLSKHSDSQIILLDILEECLEGYAILPGSSGKRDLFEWVMLEVVPSVYCCLAPSYLYCLVGKDDYYYKLMFNQLMQITPDQQISMKIDPEMLAWYQSFLKLGN
jgi:hypothetical protein